MNIGMSVGALFGTVILIASAFATDFRMMSTEELANMRGEMRNAAPADREAFQREWQEREKLMTGAEKERYSGSSEHRGRGHDDSFSGDRRGRGSDDSSFDDRGRGREGEVELRGRAQEGETELRGRSHEGESEVGRGGGGSDSSGPGSSSVSGSGSGSGSGKGSGSGSGSGSGKGGKGKGGGK